MLFVVCNVLDVVWCLLLPVVCCRLSVSLAIVVLCVVFVGCWLGVVGGCILCVVCSVLCDVCSLLLCVDA